MPLYSLLQGCFPIGYLPMAIKNTLGALASIVTNEQDSFNRKAHLTPIAAEFAVPLLSMDALPTIV